MKKLIVAAAAVLLPVAASAGDIWGAVSLTSYHINAAQKFNQRNYGAGLEYHPDNPDLIGMVGAYRNSVEVTSAYALVGWTPLSVGAVKAGIVAGAIDGYPGLNNGKVGPAVGGLIRIEGERFGANILIIPPDFKENPSPLTFGLQVKVKF